MRALDTARARPLRSLQPAACNPPPANRRLQPDAHTRATTCLLPTCMRAQPATPCGLQPYATRPGATPALDVLDAHLAASGRSYLAGADFTLADLGFVPYLNALCDAGCEDLLEARPSLHAWFERCRARPTWQAVVAMSAR